MSISPSPEKKNVRLRVYDVDVLRYLYPEWDALQKEEKLKLTKNTGPEAIKRVEVHNATTTPLHKELARCIDPSSSVDGSADQIAFGDDDSSFSSSDTSLNNRVGAVGISNSSIDLSVPDVLFESFVDSTELNGETLSEIALESTTSDIWNHADISPNISKSSSETVIAEITISFSD